MPESLKIHEPLLVNTLGHSAGVLLFGYLFYLLLRDFRGRSGDLPLLPALAAFLALIWNAGSLVVLGTTAREIPAAVSFAALSLLPAVLLSVSLRGSMPAVSTLGWTASGAAVVLHLAEALTGNRGLHSAALILISVCFVTLALVSALRQGRKNISRVMVPIALLLFATSFVHFGELDDTHVWSRELALHHAGIPLALFIVLQDYRFLLADVFIRALASGLLAAGMTVLAIICVERWNLASSAAADPFVAGLLVTGICCALFVFSSLRRLLEDSLTRYVFQRRGLDQGAAELEIGPLPADERTLIEEAAALTARHVGASRHDVCWTPDPGVFVPQPLQSERFPWAEAAVPVRFTRGDGVQLMLGRREGGRRYLSGDFLDLSRFAAAIATRVEQFRSQERERLTARAELRALQAQINPHFLFNALNALYGSIPRSADAARRTVLNLSEMFRYFLQNDRSHISLAEELRIIRAYLDVEQLRLGDRLTTEIEVDPDALTCQIPALSIEPLVENAVKHGVAPQPGPGVVRLRVECTADGLAVEVSDTGPGFQPRNTGERPGVGLENVRQRLLLSYGDCTSLTISREGRWTTVRMRIPAEAAGTSMGRASAQATAGSATKS